MDPRARHLVFVPHTHWDREWWQTHEQFRVRLVRLIDGLLDALEGNPDFRAFTLDGQTIVVDDYLAVRPAARERIRKLVEAGRLLIGPWTVLPDEWLVSGEALVRNLRNGLRRAEALGGAMQLGYVPDQFGHVGQLPQLFAGFGFGAAALWRGVGADVPQTFFQWEAPDGTRVLTVHLSRSYSNAAHLPRDAAAARRRIERECEGLARRSPVPTLLLMTGTDHQEPDPALPDLLREAAAGIEGVTWEIGTLPGFVARARAELDEPALAVHRGELRSGLRAPLLPGCASARVPQKQADFANDRLLTRWVEPLAAWCGALGRPDLADPGLLDFAWRIALENHPHDSICGCSVDAVHEQMEPRFARVREIGEAQLVRALGALGARVAAPEPADPDALDFAVWNPGAGGPTPVEVELDLHEDVPSGRRVPLRVHDAAGTALPTSAECLEPAAVLMSLALPPAAVETLSSHVGGEFLGGRIQRIDAVREADGRFVARLGVGRAEPEEFDLAAARAALLAEIEAAAPERVVFEVRRAARVRLRFVDDLPAHGIRRYRALRGRSGRAPDLLAERTSPGVAAIANEHWRVEADAAGRIALERRADGTRVEDALRLVSEGDRGDEYNFDPVPDAPAVEALERVRAGLAPRSPVDATLRVRGRLRVPVSLTAERSSRSTRLAALPVTLSVSLWAGVDRVDVRVDLDNTARDHRLRLYARAPFAAQRFEVESAFEVAERPIEPTAWPDAHRLPAEHPIGATPQRAFASIDDGSCALTVANRGNAEVEAVSEDDGSTSLAVTLLRAVGWLSRDDLALRPAHAGPPLETPGAQVPGPHTAELSLRWHAVGDETRAAEAHRFAFGPVAGPVLDAAEPALADGARLVEVDDPAVVVSAIEPRPDGRAVVRVYNASPSAREATLRWKGRAGDVLEVVDLAERPRAHRGASVEGAAVRLALRPWEIVTLRARRTR